MRECLGEPLCLDEGARGVGVAVVEEHAQIEARVQDGLIMNRSLINSGTWLDLGCFRLKKAKFEARVEDRLIL